MLRNVTLGGLIFVLGMCAAVRAADTGEAVPAGRPQISLAGDWQRQLVPSVTEQPGEKWTTIALPKSDALTKDTDGLWYQREVAVPAEWQGRQIALHVGHCMYGVVVYCNGTKAGDIPGYGGEVDLTALVKPGQSNSLRIFSGRLGQGLQRLDKVSAGIAEFFARQDKQRNWTSASLGIICPAAEFYLEARSPEAFVADAWYQTYTRGMQRIEPVLTLQATQALAGVMARVVIYDPATGAVVKEKEFALAPIPVGTSRQRLVLPAADLKRWALYQPNLYRGQVTLSREGRELDRTPAVSFGLREFWAQGKDWYLNNGPVYFVCGSQPTPAEVDAYMALGVTFFTHGVPYWGRFLNEDMVAGAELLDRKGAAYCPTGVSMSQLNMSDPELLRDYAIWTQAHARRLENHPSVLVYGLGFNTPGSSPDFIPTKVGFSWNNDWSNSQATLAYQFSQRADPTRVYYFYGGSRAPATWSANWYPNHTPTQEIEEWFSRWNECGDKPTLTFEGTTGTIRNIEYVRGGVAYDTEYAAISAGDGSYAQEAPDYRAYSSRIRKRATFWGYDPSENGSLVNQQRDRARIRTTRAWRFWGLPFYNWDYMPENYAEGDPTTGPRDDGLRKPALAWIGGPPDQWPAKDHNFYVGDRITKSLMIIRDLNGQATWQGAWEAKLAGAAQPCASGKLEQAVGAYARMKVPFSFPAPAVTQPTAATISLVVKDNTGAEIGRDEFALTIYPRPAAVPVKAPWAIYDPRGDTSAWLKARGVALAPYDPAGKTKPAVLIVGREALQGLKALPFTAEQVAAGMRVVVFEQHCRDLGNLGFQHEDCCPRQVYVRQPGSPLTAGLTAEGLRDWRGAGTLIGWGPDRDRTPVSTRTAHWSNRGTVASDILETPHYGSFLPILDCEFDLGYSPLLAWRHGAGEVLYCQLDVTGRVGQEPGADLAVDNLIRYLGQPLKLAQVKAAVCLDEATAKGIEARGFAAGGLGGKLDPARHVVVVTGAQAEAFAANRQRLVEFANAGGQVLVLYATEKLAADPAFGGKLKLTPTSVTRAGTTVEAHPLLTGVGPQNLHWREPVELSKLESADPKFITLLGGFLGVQPQGKGSFVFLQVDPAALTDLAPVKAEITALVADLKAKKKPVAMASLSDDWLQRDRNRSRWQINKLHSLLLTNLGVDSSAALTERIFRVSGQIPFTPVNAWVVLGPIPSVGIPTSDESTDALARPDLVELGSHRDMSWRRTTERGDVLHWLVPTDSMNGLGLDGKVDLAKIWGIRVHDIGIAVTYVWSTRAREATIGVGADWWLRVDVNGQQVYSAAKDGFYLGFDRKQTVPLKAGWNELVCYLGAGSNGHYFNFEITNPGDLVVAQQLTAPAAPPEGLPPVGELLPDKVEPGFGLYTDAPVATDDPYAYYAW